MDFEKEARKLQFSGTLNASTLLDFLIRYQRSLNKNTQTVDKSEVTKQTTKAKKKK